LGRPHDQGFQLLVDLWPPSSLALRRAVELLRHQRAVPGEDCVRLDDRGHFRQRVLAQLLAHLGQGRALAIAQADATVDLVAKHAIFGHEVLMAHSQFLIDSPGDIRQQVFPVHRLPPQPLLFLLTLRMGERGAEDKPKHP
jgi:hypothetical protein